MSIDLKQTDLNGIPVLELHGKIRGEGDDKLQGALEDVSNSAAPMIVVDLSKADYIDSHGLGVIIYHHKILQGTKRRLVLLNENEQPDSYMNRLIEITNLDKVIEVFSTRDKIPSA